MITYNKSFSTFHIFSSLYSPSQRYPQRRQQRQQHQQSSPLARPVLRTPVLNIGGPSGGPLASLPPSPAVATAAAIAEGSVSVNDAALARTAARSAEEMERAGVSHGLKKIGIIPAHRFPTDTLDVSTDPYAITQHPEKATYSTRLRSFIPNWPPALEQKPEVFAESGFFYTGENFILMSFLASVALLVGVVFILLIVFTSPVY